MIFFIKVIKINMLKILVFLFFRLFKFLSLMMASVIFNNNRNRHCADLFFRHNEVSQC